MDPKHARLRRQDLLVDALELASIRHVHAQHLVRSGVVDDLIANSAEQKAKRATAPQCVLPAEGFLPSDLRGAGLSAGLVPFAAIKTMDEAKASS
ncbi:hypothetical protein [Ensifer adhaerens]